MSDIDALLIAGPTASGKSRAALALAERLGGAIINADSMQVYAEVPILTAQPPAKDKAHAPHLLYGHASVRDAYSVGRYVSDVAKALGEARAQQRIPIFTGGTGLYFTTLTEGLADIPATPPALRAEARALREKIGTAAFHAQLAARDPGAANLRPGDTQRVLRAHEVLAATGRPLTQWQCENARPLLAGLRLAKFVLDVPRPELHARIETRFRAMLACGAQNEAIALAEIDPLLPAAKILGLRPLQALAMGRMDLEAAIQAALAATRQYAKRQMTWFRHRMADYHWFDPSHRNIITEFESLSV